MAKRRVIWSLVAQQDLKDTLDFYNRRNRNKRYSQKIIRIVKEWIDQIHDYPNSGKLGNDEKSRLLINGDFILVYEVNKDIHILSFWDTKRNPEDRVDNK